MLDWRKQRRDPLYAPVTRTDTSLKDYLILLREIVRSRPWNEDRETKRNQGNSSKRGERELLTREDDQLGK